MTRSVLVLSLLAGLSSLAPHARADAAAEARFHDEIARRDYAARRYEDAVREFMVEQRLAPNPNIVFNIALCFRRLNRHADAYMYFAEYLAAGDPDEGRQRESEAALSELRPHVALVRVESEPEGAAIFVDRRELGQYGVTPRVLALSSGQHRIWVEKDGYRTAEQSVDLDLGAEATVTLAMEQILGRFRLGAATAAHVRVLDADGRVVFEGDTPVDEQIAPGNYQVEATAGDERWVEPIRVRADGVTESTASLVGPTGVATVTANVSGALVSLDGSARGFTPQVLTAIPVGTHQLSVAADGMRAYESELDVDADDHTWITVDLRPDGGSGISPATWVTGGLAIAAAIAAAVTTGFAIDAHDRFVAARSAMQPAGPIAGESTTLNMAADALWLSAGVAAITAVVVFFATTDFGDEPSRATVMRGEP